MDYSVASYRLSEILNSSERMELGQIVPLFNNLRRIERLMKPDAIDLHLKLSLIEERYPELRIIGKRVKQHLETLI